MDSDKHFYEYAKKELAKHPDKRWWFRTTHNPTVDFVGVVELATQDGLVAELQGDLFYIAEE